MKKQLRKEVARGVFFYTDILDAINDAVFIMQRTTTSDEENKIDSQVCLVKDRDQKALYVLKTISCPAADTDTIAKARNEYELAALLGRGHPNIAKGIAMRELRDPTGQTHTVEVLQEYGGDDLLTLMTARKLTGQDILLIAVQTASAMQYAHSQHVFHADLKTTNIVYMNQIAKIIDFGESIHCQGAPSLRRYISTFTGKIKGWTPCYYPPEKLRKDQVAALMRKMQELAVGREDLTREREIAEKLAGFSREKIDVYLWGMTFYQLLSRKTMAILEAEWETFRESHEMYNQFKAIVKALRIEGDVDPVCGGQFITLLSSCLSYAAEDRPTFQQIHDISLAGIITLAHIPMPTQQMPSPARSEGKVAADVEDTKTPLVQCICIQRLCFHIDSHKEVKRGTTSATSKSV